MADFNYPDIDVAYEILNDGDILYYWSLYDPETELKYTSGTHPNYMICFMSAIYRREQLMHAWTNNGYTFE